jgi:hypothetical protein
VLFASLQRLISAVNEQISAVLKPQQKVLKMTERKVVE